MTRRHSKLFSLFLRNERQTSQINDLFLARGPGRNVCQLVFLFHLCHLLIVLLFCWTFGARSKFEYEMYFLEMKPERSCDRYRARQLNRTFSVRLPTRSLREELHKAPHIGV